MESTIAKWLKNARKMRGMTLDEVCASLNFIVTKQAISKYERDLMKPSQLVLDKLCKLYDIFPDCLIGIKPVELSQLSFRCSKTIPLKIEKRIIAEVKIKISYYLALEELLSSKILYKNPDFDFTVSCFEDIEKSVFEVRKKWNIGNDTIASVCRILEQVGIKVLELDLDDDIDGLCGWINSDIPFIVLKKNNVTIERKRFTALHELAHILFPSINSMDTRTKEKMCHRFASALLLPKKVIDVYIGAKREKISVSELSSIRSMYGISVAATVHRLRDLSVISENYYNHIFDERIKLNPLENGWGEFQFKDEAIRFYALINRAKIEGILPAGWDLKSADSEVFNNNFLLENSTIKDLQNVDIEIM